MRVSFAIDTGVLILCFVAAPAFALETNPASPKKKEIAQKDVARKDVARKDVTRNSFAQDLVDQTVAGHSELLGLDIHATPPNSTQSSIIASKDPERIGRKTDPDVLAVLKTGVPRVVSNSSGAEVVLPLLDVAGRPVGLVQMAFPVSPGPEAKAEARVEERAEEIEEEMREQIPTGARLVEDAWLETSGDAEVQKLPVSKAVVSGQALAQTSQEGYSEAVKDVAGVAPGNSKGSSNDSIYIRGIKLNLFSNYRLNGSLPTAGVLTSPTENKERIETLKGANGLMFGVASPAGIINLVTKRAGDRDVNSVALLGNSFGQIGGAFDVGRRFGAGRQVGVRANASVVRLENGIRNTTGDGEFASLGLDWKVVPNLILQGDIEYYRKHVPEQGGINLLPAVNGVVPITPVPDPRNLLSGKWAQVRADTKNIQMRADYFFIPGWKVIGEAGASYSNRTRFTIRISDYDINTGDNGTVRVNWVDQTYRNTFFRVELAGQFSTWFLRHDLTFGVSRSGRESATPSQNNTVMPDKLNIFNPAEVPAPIFTSPPTFLPLQISEDTGFYAYETLSIGPKLKFLFGLRLTRDREDNGFKRSVTRVNTPALGVLYDVVPGLTLFASYMEGLEAGATAPVNANNAYEIMPSAVSTQKEIGVRLSHIKDVSLSASVYEIKRANAVTDPITHIFAQSGDIEYRGLEATLSVEFLHGWTATAALQWLRSLQKNPTDTSETTIDGKVPENTPRALGNVRLAWRLPWVRGLTLNGSASVVTRRFVNPQDQGTITGYTLYSAGIGYATRIEKVRTVFLLSADNIANLRYWNSVQTGTYGTGMDRSFKASAKIDF
jgi:iron complex outermembrane receptor protein